MRNQHFFKRPTIEVWSLQITISLTEVALLIFFAIRGWKIAGMGQPGIEPTTIDLSSQSGAYNFSAAAALLLLLGFSRSIGMGDSGSILGQFLLYMYLSKLFSPTFGVLDPPVGCTVRLKIWKWMIFVQKFIMCGMFWIQWLLLIDFSK